MAVRKIVSESFYYVVLASTLVVAVAQCDQAFGVEATKVFRAGAFAVDITPREFPVIVNGGMRENKTSNVVDPLHARCLVLDDGTAREHASAITKVVLCSGKVYYDLAAAAAQSDGDRIAIVRVEQLYPIPEAELREVLSHYPQVAG